MEDQEVLERIRAKPLTRAEAASLAQAVDAATIRRALPTILSELGVASATLAAFALLAQGEKPGDELLLALLPEVDDMAHFATLLAHGAEHLTSLCVQLLEQGRMSAPRDAFATLRAAEALGDTPPPAALLLSLRRQLRRCVDLKEGIFLGKAASLVGDAFTRELGAPWIEMTREVEALPLGAPAHDPLRVLPEAAPKRWVTGYTVRQQSPAAGRNDPCPCGSGKKYKKCCMLKDRDAAPEGPPEPEPELLTSAQVGELRPQQLRRLDPNKLGAVQLLVAYRRLADFHYWQEAARLLDVLETRTDPDNADGHRHDFTASLLEAGQLELAEQQYAKLSADAQDDLRLERACARREDGLLERLEAEARRGLLPEATTDLVEVAHVLLRHSPALGILVARGALSADRALDSDVLLQTAEEARDTAALPPFEPWWDIWDMMLAKRMGEVKKRTLEQARADIAERTLTELKAATDEAQGLRTELGSLETRLEALTSERDALAKTARPDELERAKAQSAELESERRRLKNKVEQLRGLLSHSQRERAELRQRVSKLVQADADAPRPGAGQPSPSERPTAVNGDATDAGAEATDALELDDDTRFVPRRLLVPELTTRAKKSLLELPAHVGRAALALLAELGAGDEASWARVKRLHALEAVRSARVGIHYRLLCRVEETELRVLDVVHRRELETAIGHLRG
ncbi:MAG: SEC-C domain-containing protein [Polyangiaceae bacterium]|nr:SEC-C domain-containing protein [Polyangiaceae bacterium]